MQMARVVLLLLVVMGFTACKPAARTPEAAVLIREANELLQESNKSTEQWTREYTKGFTPQNRAQFPANRESLRAR